MEEDGEDFGTFVLEVIVMIKRWGDGKFSGTYLYCSCSGIQGGQISLGGGEQDILCQVVFSFLNPLRVCFFRWEAAWEKILNI
ncbi:hypothetical protein AAG906_014750 [Vitis piasezkii]